MINDTIKRQSGGGGSTNVQADTIYVSGVSASEVRQIALDVYKANLTTLSQEAANTAMSRVEALTDRFLKKIVDQNPLLISHFNTPGLQVALLNAQREYARVGDKDLEELLVSLLFSRAGETTRNLKQIALEEAITIAPKLTQTQIDILTLNLLVNDHYVMASSSEQLKNFLTLTAKFKTEIGFSSPEILHLEYTGCAKLSNHVAGGQKGLVYKLSQSYPGLFSKGFSEEDCIAQLGNSQKYDGLFVPCPRMPGKIQFNAVSRFDIREYFDIHGYPTEERRKVEAFLYASRMGDEAIQAYLIDLEPEIDFAFEAKNQDIFSLSTNPVGIAVACANIASRTGRTLGWPHRMRDM